MGSPSPPDNGLPRNGRLDGWKEIAAYVARGVRTAQRWERELGLPIHRMRTGTGEVVFADKAEIDAWLRKQSGISLANGENGREEAGREENGHDGTEDADAEPERSGNGKSRRWWRGLAAAAAVAGVAAAGWALIGWIGPGRPQRARPVSPASSAPPSSSASTPAGAQPVSLAPSTDTLIAFGADGRQVWQHRFSAPIAEYNPQQPAKFRQAWDIQDIDGDGSSEVIFARASHADPRVYGFNRDGTIRFTESIETPVRFGEYACPPVMLTHVFREQRPDFPGTFLVAGHHPLYFPAVLRRLDAQGRTAGEYWSNGHIGIVTGVQIGGRWATLVGAAHNETGGASLAVFFGNIGGSAPATRAAYACDGCPAGTPDIFLLFPRSRLQDQLGENAIVQSVSVIGADRLSIGVVNSGSPDAVQFCCGHSYYTLDRDFRVLDAELGGSYWSLQRALEADHRVTASSRFRGPGDFYPVRRWMGSGGGPPRGGSGWEVIRGPERSRPR